MIAISPPKKIAQISFLSLLFLCGCSQYAPVSVQKDNSQSPSFIVIPPNEYLHEINFANLVEESLIKSGAKVLRRPASKIEDNAKSPEKFSQTNGGGSAKSIRPTESFRDIDEFNSDYLIETFGEYKQIKFTNCKSKEIVSIFTVEKNSFNQDNLSQQVNSVVEFVGKNFNRRRQAQQEKSSKK